MFKMSDADVLFAYFVRFYLKKKKRGGIWFFVSYMNSFSRSDECKFFDYFKMSRS